MSEKKLLIGSLSNDLYRVANLVYRGSNQAAERFWQEAKKWAKQLKKYKLKVYLKKIIQDILSETTLSQENAEKFLMYSVLLQNFSLKLK